jgi:hypothetical protein
MVFLMEAKGTASCWFRSFASSAFAKRPRPARRRTKMMAPMAMPAWAPALRLFDCCVWSGAVSFDSDGIAKEVIVAVEGGKLTG